MKFERLNVLRMSVVVVFFFCQRRHVAKRDELMGRYRISGVPVVATLENRKLVGILTNRDLRFYF